MSTILDALKKSEQERKLNNVPMLTDMPTPQEPSRWQPILLGLIVVLLLVLIGFVVTLALFPSSVVPTGNAVVEQSQPRGESSTNPSNEGSAGNVRSEEGSESQNGAIVVNVVSYAVTPDKRFIMINGKLFREGEFVRAGLRVEEIRPGEVVLNLRGEQIVRRP